MPTAKTITINGITIAYDDEGDPAAPAVVLVHGHPFDRTMWRPQVERLRAEGLRVIAPDLRGYGGSAVVPGITPLSGFASDIAALMDHLGMERALLAGLSMGGQIVMEFHRSFPARVLGMVLADTTAQAETPEGRRAREEMAERLLREGMDGYADEVIAKMVSPANIQRLPEVAEHVLGMMRRTSPEGAAAALRGRAIRPDYLGSLSQADVPVLIVVGDEDEYTPISEARLMHDAIPGSRLVVIEGAAHMPNLERPTEFNAALTAHATTATGSGVIELRGGGIGC
ncbi:alpha/beta fold hydrolase [Spongiactinospora sp. TRM90649]|uniref:alpha/beta fold hydrolase n=1 Tax=Spongiactinospora sp. TRM90649 TaxID=3031114 RepID=UPI0023F7C3C3|nr:alpha/beta fold hydrolase [Spongiactinospora sp. TRM90649]MDF5758227.1 alpha/beta fold hydrolase [Spongiactinospora sp. TRM90649]